MTNGEKIRGMTDEELAALLLFFDNASLLEFVSKHKERLNLNTKIQKPSVFALQDSMILSTITRSFRLYLEEFREELLPFVAHKFEELFLYLSYKYPSIFAIDDSFNRSSYDNSDISSITLSGVLFFLVGTK